MFRSALAHNYRHLPGPWCEMLGVGHKERYLRNEFHRDAIRGDKP